MTADRLALRAERMRALLAQHEAFTAGCDTVAEHHAREIARIDERLRAVEAADFGEESVFDAGV